MKSLAIITAAVVFSVSISLQARKTVVLEEPPLPPTLTNNSVKHTVSSAAVSAGQSSVTSATVPVSTGSSLPPVGSSVSVAPPVVNWITQTIPPTMVPAVMPANRQDRMKLLHSIIAAQTPTVQTAGVQPLVIVPPPATFPPIGTFNIVAQSEVRQVFSITVTGLAYKTNGVQYFYGYSTYYVGLIPLTSKYQLDHQILPVGISNVINMICTNTDPMIDKSRGVQISAGCTESTGSSESQPSLTYDNSFLLVSNNDGTYSVPDLSSVSTVLNDTLPFNISGLQWARSEISYSWDPVDPFEVDDVLYDPTTDPIGSDGFLYLSSGYITNSSSASGAFAMKISLYVSGVTNAFQIYNGDGNPVAPTPMNLVMGKSGTNAVVTVNGGDSGRGYVLQWSSDLQHWTNSTPYFFSPVPYSASPQFYMPLTTAPQMFFRTMATNMPPQ
ncbi:MAG: hypothetical protein KGJ35_00535 [Patescibacteria group bacterium]|nr:hypothetical protein [Patescibacteria group bacterium]